MRHPAQWKVETVNSLVEDLNSSPVTALVSIKGIRNAQLQKIRKELKGDAKIRVVRKRLLLKALADIKKERIAELGKTRLRADCRCYNGRNPIQALFHT